MKNKIVVGFDQSYTDTGIAISFNGELKSVTHCYLDKYKLNTSKRKALRFKVREVLAKVDKLAKKYDAEVLVLVERVRLYSKKFINKDAIIAGGTLIALIVDEAYEYSYPVYSVDTKSWKVQVIGTAEKEENEYGIPAEKWPTILWCIDRGYDEYIIDYDVGRRTKGVIEAMGNRFTYNDNMADAIGISMYGFAKNQKLEAEY